jgi:glycosyltransferase involved in cell wall biosynthesis
MHILLVNGTSIPVFQYGGTERVIWDLGKALTQLGHQVSYLVPEGSTCDFAQVIPIRPHLSWAEQIPAGVDITHFQFHPKCDIPTPYLVTEHGNARKKMAYPLNTVFVSKNHAQRYGSDQYVLNGLDWSNYGEVNFDIPREYYHFLGKGAWRVKNLKGAINVAQKANVRFEVLGGTRLNLKRGFRYTWSRRIQFHGMVGGQEKFNLLNGSRGMIFPVRWHEPFGLAIIESLYFGCPVFATPYGAIPELVPEDCGVLSAQCSVLAAAVQANQFDPKRCHQHAVENFNALTMSKRYLEKYEQVLSGKSLNAVAPVILDVNRSLAWHK